MKSKSFSQRLQDTVNKHNRKVEDNANMIAKIRSTLSPEIKEKIPSGAIPLSSLLGKDR